MLRLETGRVSRRHAQATGAAGARPAGESVDRETWDLYRMQGARVGYGHTTFHRAVEPGHATVKIEGLIHLSIQRSGQTTEQNIRCTSTETPDGQLLGFESEIQQAPVPQRMTGRVQGNRLDIEMSDRRQAGALVHRLVAGVRRPLRRRGVADATAHEAGREANDPCPGHHRQSSGGDGARRARLSNRCRCWRAHSNYCTSTP